MNGLLLYNEQDAANNIWFTDKLIRTGKRYGMDIALALTGSSEGFNGINFIINRTRDFNIGKRFEDRGIYCFNNSKTTEIGNDKWKTYLLCKELGLPVMNTVLYGDIESADSFCFPCVMKSTDGHGGSEVFMVNSPAAAADIAKKYPEKSFILQEPSSDLGIDVRVYTVGSSALCGVLRKSQSDFRSNFSLGGSAEPFNITSMQREAVSVLRQSLDSDYIGIDFIKHKGEWVVNEIEDAAGARMLYSLGEIDICENFVRHIAEKMR